MECAKSYGADYIVTRNVPDYSAGAIFNSVADYGYYQQLFLVEVHSEPSLTIPSDSNL